MRRVLAAFRGNSRRAGAVLASAAVMFAGALYVAPAASAATCYASTCSGNDPQTTGCSSDAYTAYTTTAYNANGAPVTVELRYSPTCRAAWSRLTNNILASDGATVRQVVGGSDAWQSNPTTDVSLWWSFMVNDANVSSQACYYQGGSQYLATCTAAY